MNTTTDIRLAIVDDEALIRKALRYEFTARNPTVTCYQNDNGSTLQKQITIMDTYASATQLYQALDNPDTLPPDYLLLDMEFQGAPTAGIEIAAHVTEHYRTRQGQPIGIIIFSGRFDNPLPQEEKRDDRLHEVGGVIFEALSKGARAFVSKNAVGGFGTDNILQAIESLERGERYYFNYPVMLTLKEAAERYFHLIHHSLPEEPITPLERDILLLEAAGCTAQEIANKLSTSNETDKSIQDKQKELSRKLNTVNKSGARIAKAIQCGLLPPEEIHYLPRN